MPSRTVRRSIKLLCYSKKKFFQLFPFSTTPCTPRYLLIFHIAVFRIPVLYRIEGFIHVFFILHLVFLLNSWLSAFDGATVLPHVPTPLISLLPGTSRLMGALQLCDFEFSRPLVCSCSDAKLFVYPVSILAHCESILPYPLTPVGGSSPNRDIRLTLKAEVSKPQAYFHVGALFQYIFRIFRGRNENVQIVVV